MGALAYKTGGTAVAQEHVLARVYGGFRPRGFGLHNLSEPHAAGRTLTGASAASAQRLLAAAACICAVAPSGRIEASGLRQAGFLSASAPLERIRQGNPPEAAPFTPTVTLPRFPAERSAAGSYAWLRAAFAPRTSSEFQTSESHDSTNHVQFASAVFRAVLSRVRGDRLPGLAAGGWVPNNVLAGVVRSPWTPPAYAGTSQVRLEGPVEMHMPADGPLIRVEIAPRVPGLRQAGFRSSEKVNGTTQAVALRPVSARIAGAPAGTRLPSSGPLPARAMRLAERAAGQPAVRDSAAVPEPVPALERPCAPGELRSIAPGTPRASALPFAGWKASEPVEFGAEGRRAEPLFPLIRMPKPTRRTTAAGSRARGTFLRVGPSIVYVSAGPARPISSAAARQDGLRLPPAPESTAARSLTTGTRVAAPPVAECDAPFKQLEAGRKSTCVSIEEYRASAGLREIFRSRPNR